MNDCQICRKHEQDDPYFVAEKGAYRIYHSLLQSQLLGYLYVEPKRHVERWAELGAEERRQLPELIAELEQWLGAEVDARKIYTLTIGETVRHLHMHIIPRSGSSVLDSMDLIQQVAIRKGAFGPVPVQERQIAELTAKLRASLAD
ncbi:Diadenosine tetraphosphate (Ap4A) hydrolase [Paenibacillus sp. UNCCL117]|uniref:HIT family protein n=1 Tax=unclassified Paenibacillus TaxID=185978 RepID=UPI000884E67B|nr:MULTISPECIES: HIT domain-containing protein [unclassified Paenibacillus]SDD06365.1 Diadenosine tetraphosphate (Ap4A) hydrolase [Paenibacillus sp. cl123]SFW31708.1 Diadenosine tetraphosphate (Ap4A) hydrolase [Paenibacillus sp. UNCCL117]